MELIEFRESERVLGRGYHGNAGMKRAYVHNDTLWMVKFPQNTRNLRGKNLPSYTSSPLSEYIGSHIYASLGIAAHETVLGTCLGKIVVGCKDFTTGAQLLDYHAIKNTVEEEYISGSFGSAEQGERLEDVLSVIDEADDFDGIRDIVKMRFWDMFVVDSFICNNDRNNGNWGLLVSSYMKKLAPVFDNGNAFFNKRGVEVTKRRIEDVSLIEHDVFNVLSFFTDQNDRHIRPYDYIASMQNQDCNGAVLRFAANIDMDRVRNIIEEIPEQAFGLKVTDAVQKEFYIRLLEIAYKKGIMPVAEKL